MDEKINKAFQASMKLNRLLLFVCLAALTAAILIFIFSSGRSIPDNSKVLEFLEQQRREITAERHYIELEIESNKKRDQSQAEADSLLFLKQQNLLISLSKIKPLYEKISNIDTFGKSELRRAYADYR